MSAAPEKTLEADVRLPPQSRMSPRTQVAAGTTGPEAGSERSLSGRRLSSGEEKRKKKKKKRETGAGRGGGAGGEQGRSRSDCGGPGSRLSEEGVGWAVRRRARAAAGVGNREGPGRRQGGEDRGCGRPVP